MGTMHAGKISTSIRMQRLHALLKSGEERTSIEVRDHLDSCCPGTDVAGLRANGFVIDCRYLRMTAEGKKVYGYTMKLNEDAANVIN